MYSFLEAAGVVLHLHYAKSLCAKHTSVILGRPATAAAPVSVRAGGAAR